MTWSSKFLQMISLLFSHHDPSQCVILHCDGTLCAKLLGRVFVRQLLITSPIKDAFRWPDPRRSCWTLPQSACWTLVLCVVCARSSFTDHGSFQRRFVPGAYMCDNLSFPCTLVGLPHIVLLLFIVWIFWVHQWKTLPDKGFLSRKIFDLSLCWVPRVFH